MPDNTAEAELRRLLDIMAALRDPHGGCPWDREQSFDSIRKYTLEETYEVFDAIERRDFPHLAEELAGLLSGESDFVAKTPEFQTLVKELGMHIAAQNPRCVRREELEAAVVEQERQIYASQASGKPEPVINKIVEGKLEKFYKEACLLEQPYVRDPSGNKTINDLIGEAALQMREKIDVRRFARYQLGEALEGKATTTAAA